MESTQLGDKLSKNLQSGGPWEGSYDGELT